MSEVRADSIRVTGPLRWEPESSTGQLRVKMAGDGSRSPFELQHDGDAGYIFHLVSGTIPTRDAVALIGLGVDYGRTGLFVHNHAEGGGGVGLKITQRAGITNPMHHGLRINQESASSPAAWFGQGATGVAPAAVFTANVTPGRRQKLVRFLTTREKSSDTELGYVDAGSGALVWHGSVRLGSGRLFEEDGALKWQSPTGTITTVAPA